MKKANRFFVVTLVVAILLRFFLLFWVITYPLDVNGDQMRYEDWAQSAHMTGLANTYAAGSLNWVNTYLLHGMMRVPNLLADIGIGALLYLIVKKEKDIKRGVLAASLVWFNPVVLYNSVLWGQMDGITNLFFILALFLAFKKKYIFAILAFACSLFIKLSLLPLLPFFLLFLYFHSGKQWKPLVLGIVFSIIGIIVATFPISSNPVMWLASNWTIFSKGEAQKAVLSISATQMGIPGHCKSFLTIAETQISKKPKVNEKAIKAFIAPAVSLNRK